MRRNIVAGNWKMHHGPHETKSFLKDFNHTSADIFIFPPTICLNTFCEFNNGLSWGAQNCHYSDSGAYTGENSPAELKKLGVTSTLVGHSERRNLFGETIEDTSKKVKALQSHDIIPMLCVGESLEQRESGETNDVITAQLLGALNTADFSKEIIVAYEPVWAIGTGKVATPEQAQEAHAHLRKELKKLSPKEFTLLYGGSVKPENARDLIAMPDIDGFLVGGASLKVDSYSAICDAVLR